VSKNKFLNTENIPLNSSLGHLALGDIAFEAWRDLKKANNAENQNQSDSKKND
jgi:hypothetical protein